MELNEFGKSKETILKELANFGNDDPDYKNSKIWSLVYYLDQDFSDFLSQAYSLYSSANGLNPGAFKSLKKLENEIIAITANLLHAPPEACGVVTSGGTESCLLAVKTYRDLGADKKRIKKPEMIIPETAHVAWMKASEYFNVKIRFLPMDKTLRTDISKLEKMMNKNTVMILGSAPEYPHGTIDPIVEMGSIAMKRGIPLHVDACVGGFILPFMEMNGRSLTPWDFRVNGVTSMSADIHKYGFASKGASTILYRNIQYLKHQMFVYENWPGGIFASPAILGTRPGGAYAAAWAALHYFGKSGYKDMADRTIKAVEKLCTGIRSIDGLKILAEPEGPLLSYGSIYPEVNIFAVADQMEKKGWSINRLQRPDGLHAMVTANHLTVTDRYIEDLRECVKIVRENPDLAGLGSAPTYGMASHLPLRGMVKKRVLDIFAGMYESGGKGLDLKETNDSQSQAVSSNKPFMERIAEKFISWKMNRGGSKK